MAEYLAWCLGERRRRMLALERKEWSIDRGGQFNVMQSKVRIYL